MTILYDEGQDPYDHPKPYDINEKIYYTRAYRPPVWSATQEVIQGVNLIIPPVPNGFMYECISGGITSGTAPTFIATEGKATIDNTVRWKAVPYNLLLNTGDTITASAWTGTNSETIDNDSFTTIETKFRLTAVPVGATTAKIVNRFTVTRANGDVEEKDRTIIITIKER